ncbi:MAG: protein kinase [Gemmataceae bacterium]|nr:protein kinase [Gemmata sp.]MDW8196491.1 protein kinase [Gemmataceae bacterium]
MASDSVVGFLDRAQASRVLFPEQVAQLIRQPDIPQSNLASLCAYLLERGVLTQYQADALREGRGHDLNLAGYPLVDVIGPCRGGLAFRTLHPSLKTPLVLRRFEPDAFAPTDDVQAVIHRARTVGSIIHPNLMPILDAGIVDGTAYVVLEQPADSADLATLFSEVGGAMPGFLAAEYGAAIASALQTLHDNGGWHGEVRPGLMIVHPVVVKPREDGTPRRRPAPHAVVKLAESGLIPITPPAAVALPDLDILAFLPPERIDTSTIDAHGDIYGLGASLYLLLAGRPPFSGASKTELLHQIRTAEPVSLAVLRPDIPPELAALVMRMMARNPHDRPASASEVSRSLLTFCRPGFQLPEALPRAALIPEAMALSSVHAPTAVPVASAAYIPHAVPVAAPAPEGWGVTENAFAAAQEAVHSDASPRRRRELTTQDKNRSILWILVGLGLHLSAIGLLVAWFFGLFNSTPQPVPPPERFEQKSDSPPLPKRDKNKTKKTTDGNF